MVTLADLLATGTAGMAQASRSVWDGVYTDAEAARAVRF